MLFSALHVYFYKYYNAFRGIMVYIIREILEKFVKEYGRVIKLHVILYRLFTSILEYIGKMHQKMTKIC